MRLRRGTLNRMFFIDDIRRSKVRFAHNLLTIKRLGDFSHRSLAPPISQKVTLASAAPLQARARCLRFATNFLRHAPSARDVEPYVFYRRYTQEQSPLCSQSPNRSAVRGFFTSLPCSSSSAKSHARFGCALASAGAAPPLRYQLFAACAFGAGR